MPNDDICFLSALALRDRYQQRTLSPVEVTEATLTRIERLNPNLTAFITVTADLAMDQARAAERVYTDGGEPGALAGIPISIKDLTPTKGIRTTRGSLLSADWVPNEDVPFVERVRAAGAVELGKTNTPEMGWKGDSGNRLVGPTHNPWRHGKTAGGSSGGAAAAVAAGLGPLAQGSDGAGSIRIPAAFCGIVGFKPSFGLVPLYPSGLFGDLAHLGPMTRTVRDAALLLDVTAGGDPRDRLSWSSGIDYLAACEGDIRGLRVAWSPDLGGMPIEPEVRQVTESAARRFADLGCDVEEADPNLPDPWEVVDQVVSAAMAGYHKEDFDAVKDQIDQGRRQVVEAGQRLDAATVSVAHQRRSAYYEGMRRFMAEGRFDLLLTPTLPVTAFPAGDDQPYRVAGRGTSYLGWTAFTYPFNVTGQPAITVPCGVAPDGLPVGLQIVGRWHDDATVLCAAARFEEAFPWAHRRPDLG